MPLCQKCKKLWKDGDNLGWYNMRAPQGQDLDMNIMYGPYCNECAKKILVDGGQ